MFLKSTLSLPQISGFVAFDNGGSGEAEVRHKTAKAPAVVIAPRLAPDLPSAAEPTVEPANRWHASPTWQPPTSRWVRRIEAALIAALAGYFVLGLIAIAR